MLAQVITTGDGRRPAEHVAALETGLTAAGHTVVVHRFRPASSYEGFSARNEAVIDAIWTSFRHCLNYARERRLPATLVLEDDCEITDPAAIAVAERFIAAHPNQVDLFFLGASPNCWWQKTADPDVIRFSHVYWFHAVVFTSRFIERFADVPRTWTGANDLHFARLIARGDVAAFGLRRQVAFQRNRRNRLAERVLYRFPWGDGRRFAAPAAAAALWWSVR